MRRNIQNSIEEILLIAKKGRSANAEALESPKQKMLEVEVLNEILPLCVDLGFVKNLREAAEGFSRDTIFHDVEKNPTIDKCVFSSKETSTTPMFIITNADDVVTGVVKIFPLKEDFVGEALSNLSAIQLLTSLNLRYLRFSKLMGVGKCVWNEEGYILLSLSAAQGERLDIFLYRHLKMGSEESFFKRRKAISRVGFALAELHDRVKGREHYFPKYRMDLYKKQFDSMLLIIGDRVENLDMLRFRDLIDEAVEAAAKTSYRGCYHHGDIDLKNVFYDEEADSVTFIDNVFAHKSVSLLGEGIGLAAYDFSRFESQIERLESEGFSQGIVRQLSSDFSRCYAKIAGELPSSVLCRFFKLSRKVRDLAFLLQLFACNDERLREMDERYCQQLIDFFEKAIDCPMYRVLEIVKEVRSIDAENVESLEQELRELSALDRIRPYSWDCGFVENLKVAVYRFSEYVREKYPISGNFLSRCKFLSEESSSTPVYMIVDDKNIVKLVVKAFLIDSDSFRGIVKELSGMELLLSLKLNYSYGVMPLGLGRCVVEGKAYLLLAISVAKGERLDVFFERTISLPDALKRQKKAVRKFAFAIGELHSAIKGEKATFPQYRMKHYTKQLMLIQEKMKKNIGEINFSVLSPYLEELFEEAGKINYHYCFHHGDTYIKNIFYDELEDNITFIDTIYTHKSVNIFSAPIGIAAYDFSRFEVQLERLHCIGYCREFIDQLIDCFRSCYEEVSQELPHPLLRHFFRTFRKLRDLSFLLDHRNQGSHFYNRFDERYYGELVAYFQSLAKG